MIEWLLLLNTGTLAAAYDDDDDERKLLQFNEFSADDENFETVLNSVLELCLC